MKRKHTGTPSHLPPLDHGASRHLDTPRRPQQNPLQCARGCNHHSRGGRPLNGDPYPRRPHAATSLLTTHDGTHRPYPVAGHRHLRSPQPPHANLPTQVGGHLRGPPPRPPRPQTHPPHPPHGERDSLGAKCHPQPGFVGARHARKPAGSGGHQGDPIDPAIADTNHTPQHPTRLKHLLGIPRLQHSHPQTMPPPPP